MPHPGGWKSEDVYLIAETAYELHLQGQHEQALVIVSGLLAIDPGNLYCLDAAAALSLVLGRPKDAVHYTSALLNMSPYHVDGLARRCEANILLGRFQEVEDDLELLKRTGAAAPYRRITIRFATASSKAVANNTERLSHVKPITR